MPGVIIGCAASVIVGFSAASLPVSEFSDWCAAPVLAAIPVGENNWRG